MTGKNPTFRIFNTFKKDIEEFHSLKSGFVSLYVCGITPYDEPHLGHGRCYVVFDVLKRFLISLGYQVKHVQNFTDIDDKIINRAHERHLEPAGLAEMNIQSFLSRMKALNIIPPDIYPRVTTSIPIITQLIQKLIDKKLAYVVEGDVYYSVRKFSKYGELSKRKLDELEAGARVDVDERKADPLDFALWKKAKPGEPLWGSPWGNGRPGWHIECSAMSMTYLGEEFDIHGGGLDLVFPHHENEIAQSIGATGKKFARYWVHNGFVTVNKEKMSKSLGNFFTLKDIFAVYDPMVVRYFLLTQHYRSPLNFSDQELKTAAVTWNDRIKGAYRIASRWDVSHSEGSKSTFQEGIKFTEALSNDLNTPLALASLNNVCAEIFAAESKGILQPRAELQRGLSDMLKVLGLVVTETEVTDERALTLLKERNAARAKKDWKMADQIRDELQEFGFTVEDTSTGPRLKKI